jgi:hypothetical protein
MAAWTEEGIALDIGFTSYPDAYPWELGSSLIGISIGYTSYPSGVYKMQGISLDVDYTSLLGSSNFNFVNDARRATLIAGDSLITTGAFNDYALRATLNTEAEVTPTTEHGDIVADSPMHEGVLTGYLHNQADIEAESPMSIGGLDAGATIEAESPMHEGSLTGTIPHGADIVASSPHSEASIISIGEVRGDISGTSPMSTPEIHGMFPNNGDIEATSPFSAGFLDALLTNRADIEAESPMSVGDINGLITLSASISVISPMSYPDFIVTQESLEEFLVLILNTENNALSEYDNFEFNSLTEFNGKFIGCKSDGIYSLEGNDDEGVDIEAEIAWPIYDFAEDIPKLPREAWIMGRKEGTLVLTVTSDEGDESYPYPTAMQDSLISEERVEFGRGLRGRFFDFKLTNENGAFFDFNNIRILAEQSVESKRRR